MNTSSNTVYFVKSSDLCVCMHVCVRVHAFVLSPIPCKIRATALPENFSSLRLARKLLISALIWFSQSNNYKQEKPHRSTTGFSPFQTHIWLKFPVTIQCFTLYLLSSSTSKGASIWLRSRLLSKYSERRLFRWRLRLSSKSSTQDDTWRNATLQYRTQGDADAHTQEDTRI